MACVVGKTIRRRFDAVNFRRRENLIAMIDWHRTEFLKYGECGDRYRGLIVIDKPDMQPLAIITGLSLPCSA
jgi:hypothetical protein